MLKKKSAFINLKLVAFWIVTIIALDLIIGHFFVPFYYLQSSSGLNITDYLYINCLHPYYNHGFEANKKGIKQYGSYKYQVYTNSLHMIAGQNSEVKNDTRKKIVFIGDSFTEGVGLPYSKTFCGIIQSKTDTTKIDILNAAVSSFSPKLYYLRIKYLIEHEGFKPSEIFCFVDYSDYGDELVYEDFIPALDFTYAHMSSFLRHNSIIYNSYHFLARKYFLIKSKIEEGSGDTFIYWVKTNNEFLNRYPDFYLLRQEWAKEMNNPSKTLEHSIELAESHIDSLNLLCLKNKIELHLVVYPHNTFIGVKTAHSHYPESLWKNYCNKKNIDFISLFPAFISDDTLQNIVNQKKYFIPDDSHWNENGHLLVADKISAYIHP
jgi:lysophospholipase L1-like esterase